MAVGKSESFVRFPRVNLVRRPVFQQYDNWLLLWLLHARLCRQVRHPVGALLAVFVGNVPCETLRKQDCFSLT